MADIKVAGKEALQTLWHRVYEEYPRGITKGTSSASGLPIHLRKGYDNNGTWVSTGNTDTMTLTKSDITALGIPGSNTTYSLTGALASHKFTTTLNGSDGSTSPIDLTFAAGSNITLTDNAANNKITIGTSAEVNQNAFSNIKVGSTTIAADSKTDTLELVAGSTVTLTPDATNDKVTITATDTRYQAFTGATASADGTEGLVPQPSAGDQMAVLWGNGNWQTLGANLSNSGITNGQFLYVDQNGSNPPEVYGASGLLMTSAERTKLAGIATGAEVNQNAFSRIVVGSTNIDADAKSDALTLVAGSLITLTPDATNDRVTIAAQTDTSRAPIASPAFTGTPTVASAPAAGDNSSKIPTTAWVQTELLSAMGDVAGALVYKGTVDAASDLLGIALKKGWYYVADGDFTLNGEQITPGDMIIVKTAGTYTTEADLDTATDIVGSNTTLLKQSDMTDWFTIPPVTPSA